MKVFISQPMKGRTDKEILDERDAVIEYLKQKYSDISIIDSFLDIEPPEVKTISVFYLGKSIQLLSDADLCVVVGDVSDNNGCQIEMEVCKRYGIELIQLSLTPNPDKDLFSLSSDLEDQEIQTFSETKAEPATTEELTEAEDQISDLENQEREEDSDYRQEHSERVEYDTIDDMVDGSDKSKEELMAMDSYRLRSTMILNKTFDYGTPAGSDSASCPECGPSYEDAADAAIIDAEITPTAPTVDPNKKPMNPSGGDSGGFGGGSSGDDDMFGDDDFSFMSNIDTLLTFTSLCNKIAKSNDNLTYLEYTLGCQLLKKESFIPAQENWDDYTVARKVTLRTIFLDLCQSAAHYAPLLFKGLLKIINSTKRFIVKSATKLQRVFHELSDNSEKLCEFWQVKMKKYILKANVEKLESAELLGFEFNDWVTVVKTCLRILETVDKSANSLVASSDADAMMTKIVEDIQSIGIKTSSTGTKTDNTELMEKWTKGSVIELGFNPRVMSGCMNYIAQIVSVLGKDDSAIHKALMKVVEKTESVLQGIKDNKEVGDDTKKLSYQILQADVAVRYLTTIVTTVQKLLNRCVKQVYLICKKYEAAMIPEIS